MSTPCGRLVLANIACTLLAVLLLTEPLFHGAQSLACSLLHALPQCSVGPPSNSRAANDSSTSASYPPSAHPSDLPQLFGSDAFMALGDMRGGHNWPVDYSTPYLVIPPNGSWSDPGRSFGLVAFTDANLKLRSICSGDGTASAPPCWFTFFQVRSTGVRAGSGQREIGAAVSQDEGVNWTYLGVVLSEPCSLSSPWVAWDSSQKIFVMVPHAHGSGDTVQVYTTSAEMFPFGWTPQPSPALSGRQFRGTTAVQHEGLWWVFVTVKEEQSNNDNTSVLPLDWGRRSQRSMQYRLYLYHTTSLLDTWVLHPQSPISTDLRYTNSVGRPFVMKSQLHRWTADRHWFHGRRLHLMRADTISTHTFLEVEVQSAALKGIITSSVAQISHVGIQPRSEPEMGWVGLVDVLEGRGLSGNRHLNRYDYEDTTMRQWLLRLLIVQALIGIAVYSVLRRHEIVKYLRSVRCYQRDPMLETVISPRGSGSLLFRVGWRTTRGLRRAYDHARPEIWLFLMIASSSSATLLLFVMLPSLYYCPRGSVHVQVTPSPKVTHVDVGAPFNISGLMVISAATAGFFDRSINMIASLQVWEPDQRAIVYDLGYSQAQLTEMMCWRNVEVRRFPFELFPEHVQDVRNYAFKALAIAEAMKEFHTVLWIDSGLELRAPMYTLRSELERVGHVSAMQDDLLSAPMYTMTPVMAKYLLKERWAEYMTRSWMNCAGGLQGFVQGSDAERLILMKVVECSLDTNCIVPSGASRANFNFDQTAFSLLIWANNFTCLPQATHCMWSVKKASRDPLQLSTPIELVSRGHRLPRPYTRFIQTTPGCTPSQDKVPWPVRAQPLESLGRHRVMYKLLHVYMQPLGDAIVTCFSCLGTHVWVPVMFSLQLVAVGSGLWLPKVRAVWVENPVRCRVGILWAMVFLGASQLAAFMFGTTIR